MPNQLSLVMDELFPGIQATVKDAFESSGLFGAVPMRVKESGQSVRLSNSAWRNQKDEFVPPVGEPQVARRFLRTIELNPLEDDRFHEKIKDFAEETADLFFVRVIEGIRSQARQGGVDGPTEGTLEGRARNAGGRCCVIARPSPYLRLKHIKNGFLDIRSMPDDGSAESPLRSGELLLIPLARSGPSIELLEPEFVIDWMAIDRTRAELTAHRRIYLNNGGNSFFYQD